MAHLNNEPGVHCYSKNQNCHRSPRGGDSSAFTRKMSDSDDGAVLSSPSAIAAILSLTACGNGCFVNRGETARDTSASVKGCHYSRAANSEGCCCVARRPKPVRPPGCEHHLSLSALGPGNI